MNYRMCYAYRLACAYSAIFSLSVEFYISKHFFTGVDTLPTISEKGGSFFSVLECFSGLPPLLFRMILAPVLIIAGYSKLGLSREWETLTQAVLADPGVVSWFGNSDWGLGLPVPGVLAFLVGWIEFVGGWLLLIGLGTRVVAVPLLCIMLGAACMVHWENGWFAITPTDSETSAARVLEWVNIPGARESLENSEQAGERLGRMRSILEENGLPDYLYATGKPVILNNGIEFAAVYFAMLLSLVFTGGGRFTSIDDYIKRVASRYHIE